MDPTTDIPLALTYDDVLLVPGRSSVLPREVDTVTHFGRGIELKIPLLAAAMDTVTESATAIAMARVGGMGFVHKSMSCAQQAKEVEVVKKSVTGVISDPITLGPDELLFRAREVMSAQDISGIPIIQGKRLCGILTNRDLRFERNLSQPIRNAMTDRQQLVTVTAGTTLEEAKDILQAHKIEKLPVVDTAGNLVGLITIKDIEKAERFPSSARDPQGRLRVGAAVGVGADRGERVAGLVEAGADVICIDTAHGHSEGVLRAVAETRAEWPDICIVGGNVATPEATLDLIKAGVDVVKVGIGPGSICTTRIVAGVGVPQFSAVLACAAAAAKHDVPIIADGGVKHSGDIPKALVAGAATVMVGSLLAGTEEAPGATVLFQGRRYKTYRGMGSVEAMRDGSGDRYFQDGVVDKLVPEGIVGRVPYRGPLAETIYQLMGGLRSSMGYLGCGTLGELAVKGRAVRITSAGLRESHVHDVIITHEAPNYRVG